MRVMAQQQTDANARSAFFEWLARNVSPACLSDLYVAATDLETYCVNKKFLNEPIFEVSDAATIDRLRVCLSRDKIFKDPPHNCAQTIHIIPATQISRKSAIQAHYLHTK